MVAFIAFRRMDVYKFAMDLRLESKRHNNLLFIYTNLSRSHVVESIGNRFYTEGCENALFDVLDRIMLLPLSHRPKPVKKKKRTSDRGFTFKQTSYFKRFTFEPYTDQDKDK